MADQLWSVLRGIANNLEHSGDGARCAGTPPASRNPQCCSESPSNVRRLPRAPGTRPKPVDHRRRRTTSEHHRLNIEPARTGQERSCAPCRCRKQWRISPDASKVGRRHAVMDPRRRGRQPTHHTSRARDPRREPDCPRSSIGRWRLAARHSTCFVSSPMTGKALSIAVWRETPTCQRPIASCRRSFEAKAPRCQSTQRPRRSASRWRPTSL